MSYIIIGKMKGSKQKVKQSQVSTYYLLTEATKITFKLLAFPVLLLFFGLFIDKTLGTTPFFLVVGFIAGLFFAFLKVRTIKKNFRIK